MAQKHFQVGLLNEDLSKDIHMESSELVNVDADTDSEKDGGSTRCKGSLGLGLANMLRKVPLERYDGNVLTDKGSSKIVAAKV